MISKALIFDGVNKINGCFFCADIFQTKFKWDFKSLPICFCVAFKLLFLTTLSQMFNIRGRVDIWPLKRPNQPKFGLFWNYLLEIKWFGHLAIFWPILKVEKKQYILRLALDTSGQNLHYLIKLFIIFFLFLRIFFENLAFLWPF